jgi:hypothetical protein
VGSVVTWALAKYSLWDLMKLIYSTQFGFYASDQIVNMSLNGLRRQVATHHKTLIGPLMDEPSIALDLGTILQLRVSLRSDFVS